MKGLKKLAFLVPTVAARSPYKEAPGFQDPPASSEPTTRFLVSTLNRYLTAKDRLVSEDSLYIED